MKALAPIADASALTVVRDTVSSTLRSAAENRISGLVETKAGEFDALIAGDYRFDETRAERETGRASRHDARLAAYTLKKAYDTYYESMPAKLDLDSMEAWNKRAKDSPLFLEARCQYLLEGAGQGDSSPSRSP